MDFWSLVDMTGNCWQWTGGKNSGGYGVIWDGRRAQLAHRVSYAINVGPSPDGTLVLHRCDNPSCVRPDHLYAGTAAQNAKDRSQRRRYRDYRGSLHPSAKLNEPQVVRIRERLANGAGLSALAREYGVTPFAIYRIKTRRSWRHI